MTRAATASATGRNAESSARASIQAKGGQEQGDSEREPVVVQQHGAAQRQGGDRPRSVDARPLAAIFAGRSRGGGRQRGGQRDGGGGPGEVGLEVGDPGVGDSQGQDRDGRDERGPWQRVWRSAFQPEPGGGVECGERGGGRDERHDRLRDPGAGQDRLDESLGVNGDADGHPGR